MTASFSWEQLRQCGGDSHYLREWLEDLAPWWLDDPAPRPPQDPGSVTILAVNAGSDRIAGLARGILLPLQWRQTDSSGRNESARLPEDLQRVAAEVQALVDSVANPAGESAPWTLCLHPCLGRLDLRGIPWRADSAFLALAAALITVRFGGSPQPHVFASACWKDNAWAKVDGLADKLAAVARTATAPGQNSIVFLHPDDVAAARSLTHAGVECRAIEPNASPFLLTLGKLLEELEIPPPIEAPLAQRTAYVNRRDVRTNHKRAHPYYLTHLAKDLAAQTGGRRHVAKLAMAAGQHHTLNSLSLHLFEPAGLLLLCKTPENEAAARDFLADHHPRFLPDRVQFRLMDSDYAAVTRDIAAWLAGADSLVQGTDGDTELKLALAISATRAKVAVVHLEVPYRDGGPVYGEPTARYFDFEATPGT